MNRMRSFRLALIAIMVLILCCCSPTVHQEPLASTTPSVVSESNQNASPTIVVSEILADDSSHTMKVSSDTIQNIVLENLRKHLDRTAANISPLTPKEEMNTPRRVAHSGAHLLIRGSAVQKLFPGVSSVTLEAVNSKSGVVLAAAAGRSEDLHHAASEAASRLATEMLNRKLLLE
jgi:hypothetical protein